MSNAPPASASEGQGAFFGKVDFRTSQPPGNKPGCQRADFYYESSFDYGTIDNYTGYFFDVVGGTMLYWDGAASYSRALHRPQQHVPPQFVRPEDVR